MKAYVEALLDKAFKTLGIDLEPIILEQPKDMNLGDYALTAAFLMAKRLKKPPQQIAQEWVDQLKGLDLTETMHVSVVGAYINIRLSDGLLNAFLRDFKAPYSSQEKQKKTILIEFVSANPTGPLHVGHARWAVIGDMYARIARHFFERVDCEFYINDAGVQIEKLNESIEAKKKGETRPEGGYQGAYITDLSKNNKEPVRYILQMQKQSLAALRVHFDSWFSERSLHDNKAIEAALSVLDQGALYTKEGALWFRSTNYGDTKDRVLKKSDGHWTYFAVDVAYHANKLSRNYDELINIWGADHHGYVARIQAAIQALGHQKKEPLRVVLGQMVSLLKDNQPVKLSKRAGNMLYLDELLDEVGVDASRIFLAQQSIGTHSKIDLEDAKKKNMDNPVYTMQYAHARFCRILERFEGHQQQLGAIFHPEERALIMHMLRFESVLEDVLKHVSIHLFIDYMLKLAKQMHRFYECCPIQDETLKIASHRLYIVNRAQAFLNTLLEQFCAVEAPQQM